MKVIPLSLFNMQWCDKANDKMSYTVSITLYRSHVTMSFTVIYSSSYTKCVIVVYMVQLFCNTKTSHIIKQELRNFKMPGT